MMLVMLLCYFKLARCGYTLRETSTSIIFTWVHYTTNSIIQMLHSHVQHVESSVFVVLQRQNKYASSFSCLWGWLWNIINTWFFNFHSDVESCAPVVCHETAGTESNQASSKKPSSRKSSENGEKKESKIRKKKVKKENETKNESAITLETDTSALDGSMKQDEKKESGAEAKKKVKKPKDPKESKWLRNYLGDKLHCTNVMYWWVLPRSR